MTRTRRGRRLSGVLSAVLLAALVLSVAPAPAFASAATDAEAQILSLVNAKRVSAGLVPLRKYHALAVVAGQRAARMRDANTLSHSVGGNMAGQLANQGVTWYSYGETIGYAYGGYSAAAKSLVDAWMGSSAHRALLMSTKFNYVGAGLSYRSSNGRYYGSVVLIEGPDINGARSYITGTSISGGDDITWSWSGYDLPLQSHTAGLRDFDVQYRIGSGSWRTIRNDTTARSITLYNRTRGVPYGVRVRATDKRGNAGAWTAGTYVTLR